jgi:restriction system protein
LSDEDRSRFLPSGQQTVIANRVGWAKTYLKKAGLLDNPRRGIVRITRPGIDVLARKPGRIDSEFLTQFPVFLEYKERAKPPDSPPSVLEALTPEESLASSYQSLRSALADELLERVKGCSPGFFERLVVELLVAMGYGGSLADAGQVVGRVGDGGIDGIIKEDKLGLDFVCIQAKRWENTVSRPEVQKFSGSMDGFRASKGVMITTSSFSKDAQQYVETIGRRIVLIDGPKLAELMIDHDIGVTTTRTYRIKRTDADYFEEDGG